LIALALSTKLKNSREKTRQKHN